MASCSAAASVAGRLLKRTTHVFWVTTSGTIPCSSCHCRNSSSCSNGWGHSLHPIGTISGAYCDSPAGSVSSSSPSSSRSVIHDKSMSGCEVPIIVMFHDSYAHRSILPISRPLSQINTRSRMFVLSEMAPSPSQ